MQYLSRQDFAQKIRDGEAVGLTKVQTYQALRDKGYRIEGDPEPLPTQQMPEQTSDGFFGYLTDTATSALRELGSVAKGAVHYATNPQEIIPDAVSTGRDTLKAIGQTAVGAGQNIYESVTGNQAPQYNPDGTVSYPQGGTQEQQVANAIGGGIKQAVTNPLETFKNHPLQTLSTVAPIAGGVLKGAGFAKAGNAVSYLDPVKAVTQGVPKAAKGLSQYGKEGIGTLTGAGGGAVDVASTPKAPGGAFYEGMRGDPLDQARQLADDAQKGIKILKEKRAADYLKTSEALKSITEPLDDVPVKNLLGKTMDEFSIGKGEKDLLNSIKNMSDEQSIQHLQKIISEAPDNGTLSPLVKAGLGEGPTAKKIAKAIEYTEGWEDFTPKGLDKLQQSLSSIEVKPGTREAAFITKIKKGVQQVVKDKYPEYEKMLADYSDASNNIDELQAAIGARDRAGIETSVRKISQSLKTGNQGFQVRQGLIREMEKATGVKLSERAAGMAFNSAYPRGLTGVGTAVTTGLLSQFMSPMFIMGLAASSPRVVGEVLGALGVGKKYVAPFADKIRSFLPPDYFINAAVGAKTLNDATNPSDDQR